MKKFIRNFIILSILLIVYGFFIEPNLLIVNDQEIKLNTIYNNEMNIVIFGDTHYNEDTTYEEILDLVTKINAEDPDIVIFLGDLMDDYSDSPPDIDLIEKGFRAIRTPYKYAVMGNHDYGGGAENTYKEVMEQSEFKLLINEVKILKEFQIQIIGLDDWFFGEPDLSLITQYGDFTNIVLTHEGDIVTEFEEGFGLALSAHSHGGQVNLPIIRDYVAPEGAKTYIKGLYELNENDFVFTTSGVGTTKVDFRLFNIPEIVNLTLKY